MSLITSCRVRTCVSALGAAIVAASCGEVDNVPTAPHGDPALASAAIASAFQQVSAGGSYTCGVTVTGRGFCWGFNLYGQLGDGTQQQRLKPTAVAGGLVFRSISASDSHSCGVTTENLVYCWGFNREGQLGDGTTQDRQLPRIVAGGRRYGSVSTGAFHTCAVGLDGRGYCWGHNVYGQLGDGTHTDRHAPVPVAGGRQFRQVGAGLYHSCAVTPSNQAYCWGWDDDGVLGDGTTKRSHAAPSLVAGGHPFSQISAGVLNTCAVTTADRAFCWGVGPVGDGTRLARFDPRPVSLGISFRRVTAGRIMCGVSTVGKAYCWGAADDGSLGDGVSGPEVRTAPVAVRGGHTFAQLSAGEHTCGKATDGTAFCWGKNSSGELGDGTTQSQAIPTRVLDPQ
jgi:alpha-tubulin suppressor-like RCC1 family protein